MDDSSMENWNAVTRTTPTVDFEKTTTLPLDAKPFSDLTASDNGKREYTDSDSVLKLKPMDSKDMKKLIAEFSDLWESTIVASSVPGIYQSCQMRNLTDGSIGHFLGEVEP